MNHIKVYRTDIDDRGKARLIRRVIQNKFENHDVSFDLEDVDNVLRVESTNDPVDDPALNQISKAMVITLNNYLNKTYKT